VRQEEEPEYLSPREDRRGGSSWARRDASIKIAIASNRSGAPGKLDSAGIYADLIVDRNFQDLLRGLKKR
jgi:hypothetical protein